MLICQLAHKNINLKLSEENDLSEISIVNKENNNNLINNYIGNKESK